MTTLTFDTADGPIAFEATRLVVAGWTGRDRAAIEHHIEELARLGVPRPSSVPVYYRLARALLTQASDVDVVGSSSSGEVEPVLLRHAGRWWLTVGSDHTDRAAEALPVPHTVALSKQLCAKPLARTAWDWEQVRARADAVQLRSSVFEGDEWRLYQDGTLAAITPLADLLAGLPPEVPVADGLVMFCGTLGAIANSSGVGIRPALAMRLALIDARASRRIEHEYRAHVLPWVA